MRSSLLVASLFLFSAQCVIAQAVRTQTDPNPQSASRSTDPMDNIANDMSRITRAVETLNKNWGEFIKVFSTNQGLQLNDRAQKLLLALEVLNRFNVDLANLQKQKLDLQERQSRFRLQLATVTDDLLPQSIDRYIAMRGTTDAEGLREIRRIALERERRELTAVLNQIERDLNANEFEIRRTEAQVRNLRNQIFGEVEKQLADL